MGEIDRLSLIVDELLILSRSIELELRDGGEAGTAWCAAPDLDRSIDALIENALRYSPSGSTVSVEVGAHRIEVLDRGPGLEPGEEEAVFDRFRRGSAGRRGPSGTGLGLPIAVGISIAASGLVSQQIGLASEPITAGDALAPQVERTTHGQKPRHVKPVEPPTTTTEAQPPATEPEPEPEPQVESNPPGGEGDHGGGDADDRAVPGEPRVFDWPPYTWANRPLGAI
jgi:hypothetical protein